MSDAFHAEFTGERVIPGQVEDNLFNEHLARYRFAARLANPGGAVLDAGCGVGYGTAELAKACTEALGIDVAVEAIQHANATYGAESNVRFALASCTAVPAQDESFHLITGFEVIEHLTDWREFLVEARRVLHPAGLFLVSTPNQLYYAESREKAGPNPFHVHEFTEKEFRSEVSAVFPHVKMLLQNHVEGIAFSGADAEGAAIEISGRSDDPSGAHFFLAVCGKQPLPPIERFVFLPDTGNVLQTRERHIALLEGEIRQKNQWIATEKAARGRMEEKVRSLEAELEEHNRWARKANQEAERRATLVAELQVELRKSNEWAQRSHSEAVERGQRIEQLQAEVAKSTAWAQARDAEAEERGQRVVELQAEAAKSTAWAQERDAEAEARGARVLELQDELVRDQQSHLAEQARLERENAASTAGYEAAIEQWRRDKAASDQWALENGRLLNAERSVVAAKQAEIEIAEGRIAALQAEAGQLREQLAQANARMDMIAQSRWVRMGRAFRVGPEITRT